MSISPIDFAGWLNVSLLCMSINVCSHQRLTTSFFCSLWSAFTIHVQHICLHRSCSLIVTCYSVHNSNIGTIHRRYYSRHDDWLQWHKSRAEMCVYHVLRYWIDAFGVAQLMWTCEAETVQNILADVFFVSGPEQTIGISVGVIIGVLIIIAIVIFIVLMIHKKRYDRLFRWTEYVHFVAVSINIAAYIRGTP